jgi:hypothetical protein
MLWLRVKYYIEDHPFLIHLFAYLILAGSAFLLLNDTNNLQKEDQNTKTRFVKIQDQDPCTKKPLPVDECKNFLRKLAHDRIFPHHLACFISDEAGILTTNCKGDPQRIRKTNPHGEKEIIRDIIRYDSESIAAIPSLIPSIGSTPLPSVDSNGPQEPQNTNPPSSDNNSGNNNAGNSGTNDTGDNDNINIDIPIPPLPQAICNLLPNNPICNDSRRLCVVLDQGVDLVC